MSRLLCTIRRQALSLRGGARIPFGPVLSIGETGSGMVLYAGVCASLIRLRKLRPNVNVGVGISLALMTGLKRCQHRTGGRGPCFACWKSEAGIFPFFFENGKHRTPESPAPMLLRRFSSVGRNASAYPPRSGGEFSSAAEMAELIAANPVRKTRFPGLNGWSSCDRAGRLCESVPVQPTDHCYSIPNGWFPFQSGMEFTCKSVLVGKRWTRNLSEKPTVCVA